MVSNKGDDHMKKLLVLGASSNEITLVKRAQFHGIYVIVTDYNKDHKLSPAKDIADEYWDISWSDIETLYKKCIINKIDGVTAGYSEIRVENLIKLCKRLNLPCYITEEQLEITRDKIKFKNLCRLSGVPVVKEYRVSDENINFPVIIKPTDRGGSIGVGIAYNENEFENVYNYALDKSLKKEVIIEKYIVKQRKIDVYYSIIDSNIEFLTSSDTIMAPENEGLRVVQNAWLYPSKYQEEYLKKVDPQMRDLINKLGIKNGYIFFSGFVDDDLNFMFFETGFRLCGGHIYAYLEPLGQNNNLDIFIFNALGVKIPNYTHNINNKLKCVSANFYATKGTVAQMLGLAQVSNLRTLVFKNINCYLGEICNDNFAILNKLGMFTFCSESVKDLISDIEILNSTFNVLDDDGNSIIYSRFRSEVLKDWWQVSEK